MQYSYALSELVLASVCFFVFFRFCKDLSSTNRASWGIFFLIVATTALIGMCKYLGMGQLERFHQYFIKLSNTVGILSLLIGIGTLSLRTVVSTTMLVVGITVGLGLFMLFFDERWYNFINIIPAFAVLMGMLLAVYGLTQKNKSMIWLILGIMALGIATKIPDVDLYHYTLAIGMYLLGRSIHESKRVYR